MPDSDPATGTPSSRSIAGLALPALGVLAAEPLYLLFDLAVVGRLGALALAGLAIGALVLGLVSSQGTFLSYGTTARSARHFGAGDRGQAVGEGVQATWLAVGLGLLIVTVVEVAAAPITTAIAGSGDIAGAALPWLRIAILGAPAILISLAGNGWMRGVQDTRAPMLIAALSYWGIGIPTSYVLAFVLNVGGPGLWLGLVVGLAFAAGLLMLRFWRGHVSRIAVRVPQALHADLAFFLNGQRILPPLQSFADRLEGVVGGLRLGANTLQVAYRSVGGRTPGRVSLGPGAVQLVNHPVTGPVFSGPQLQPFECRTAQSGLGAPLDAQCSAATRHDWFYMRSSGSLAALPDPTGPRPADLADTTTSEGKRVPFVRSVAREARPLAGASTSGVGTGGMASKVEAARRATLAGADVVIAAAREALGADGAAQVAQRLLRHKSSKQTFRQIYWGTVAGHWLALLLWLYSAPAR